MVSFIACCCSYSAQSSTNSNNCKTVSAPICILSLAAGGVLYFINEKASLAALGGGVIVMGLASCYFEYIATRGVDNFRLSELTSQLKNDLALLSQALQKSEENEKLISDALVTAKDIESLSLSSGKTAQNTAQNQSAILAYVRGFLVNLGVINQTLTAAESSLIRSQNLSKDILSTVSSTNKERSDQLTSYNEIV